MATRSRPRPRPVTLWSLLAVGVVLLWLATLAGFGGGWWWLLDLCAHFHAQYAVLFLLLLLPLAVRRRWGWATACAAGCLLNAAFLLPYMLPAAVPSAGAATLRVASVNALGDNTEHELLLDFVRAEQPDVLAVLELRPSWAVALAPLHAAYPHRRLLPREDNFGIGLYSRLQLSEVAEFDWAGGGVPSIVARVATPGGQVTVIATHPVPPGGAAWSRERDRQLAALAAQLQGLDGPVVVMGDLNASPWSAPLRRLRRATGLRDSAVGHGYRGTWPTGFTPLLIPIDHILVSPEEIQVLDRRRGPWVGSDHFPAVADLVVGQD